MYMHHIVVNNTPKEKKITCYIKKQFIMFSGITSKMKISKTKLAKYQPAK